MLIVEPAGRLVTFAVNRSFCAVAGMTLGVAGSGNFQWSAPPASLTANSILISLSSTGGVLASLDWLKTGFALSVANKKTAHKSGSKLRKVIFVMFAPH